MNPVETIVPIVLGGVKRAMVFNANTMAAFEEVTGKFFLDVVATLYQELEPHLKNVKPEDPLPSDATLQLKPLDIMRKVPMRDLRALLWAALHEYDENDEPHWPLTLHQVGRLLHPGAILPIFNSFLTGNAANMPDKAELGESKGETASAPVLANGGPASTELPEAAFG